MTETRKYATWVGAVLGGLLALLLTLSAHAQVTQDFHRTVPLSSNGRVSLDNVNGGVEITGWDRNEVQIDAVKQARDQQRLDEARIEVEAGSDYVKIQTQYPHEHTNNNPASVHYTLHVPQNARLDQISLVNGSLIVQKVMGELDARLVNGKARISDLTGEANISSVNGSIEANYASLNNVREIKLKSVNGSVELGLPGSPNADVKASTVNGGIKSDFPLTVQGSFSGHNLSGTLGSGGTRIELSNVNGSIHVASGSGSL
jgi:Putative adhesin